MIEVACPGCCKNFMAMAGQMVRCPRCNRLVVASEDLPAFASQVPEASGSGTIAPNWQTHQERACADRAILWARIVQIVGTMLGMVTGAALAAAGIADLEETLSAAAGGAMGFMVALVPAFIMASNQTRKSGRAPPDLQLINPKDPDFVEVVNAIFGLAGLALGDTALFLFGMLLITGLGTAGGVLLAVGTVEGWRILFFWALGGTVVGGLLGFGVVLGGIVLVWPKKRPMDENYPR